MNKYLPVWVIFLGLMGTTNVFGQGAITVSERLDVGSLSANASNSGFGFNWATLDSAECFGSSFSDDEVLAHAEAACSGAFDCGSFNAAALATALCPVPIGGFSAAPYATAVANGNVSVSAGNNCEASMTYSGNASAFTRWRVDAQAPNLFQELFVWVVINGGEIRIQNIGGDDKKPGDLGIVQPRCPITGAYAEVDNHSASVSYSFGSGAVLTSQGFGMDGQPIFAPNGFNQGFHLIRPFQGTRSMDVNASASVGSCYGVNRFENGTESALFGTVGLAFFTIRQ